MTKLDLLKQLLHYENSIRARVKIVIWHDEQHGMDYDLQAIEFGDNEVYLIADARSARAFTHEEDAA